MTYAQRLEAKLTQALAPNSLLIEDESHRHAGHGGSHRDGETHFRVSIVSGAFEGKSRIDRQRLVYRLVAEELAERVHALSLVLRTPAEAAQGTD